MAKGDWGALLQGLGEGYLKGQQLKMQQEELNLKKKKQTADTEELVRQLTVASKEGSPAEPYTYTPGAIGDVTTLQPHMRPETLPDYSGKLTFDPFKPIGSLTDYTPPRAPSAPGLPSEAPSMSAISRPPAPKPITTAGRPAVPAVPERPLTSEERLEMMNVMARSKPDEIPTTLPSTGEKLGLGPKIDKADKMIHFPAEIRNLVKKSYNVDLPADIPPGIAGIISSALSSEERKSRSGLALKKYKDQEERYKTGLRAKARSQAIREMYENDYFYGQESTKDDTIIDKVSERADEILTEWKTGKPSAKKETEKQIDVATATAILNEAGGDKEKARKIARERGYKF